MGEGGLYTRIPKFRFRNARVLARDRETEEETERTAIGGSGSVPPLYGGGVEGESADRHIYIHV